ncbi:unnamed protein product [Sphenostylis stenocarpa]|uniref:Uncharacterized protein n=1 Tax=Sphenostylis stenocarpa TaxID=92480 RepID=A0AA86S089_9FABA|nr:unnamed protein product [Sphenostylis stenocarpa]
MSNVYKLHDCIIKSLQSRGLSKQLKIEGGKDPTVTIISIKNYDKILESGVKALLSSLNNLSSVERFSKESKKEGKVFSEFRLVFPLSSPTDAWQSNATRP